MKRQSVGSPAFSFAGLDLTSGCYPSILHGAIVLNVDVRTITAAPDTCRETSSANLQLIQGVLTRLSDRKDLGQPPRAHQRGEQSVSEFFVLLDRGCSWNV